MMRPDAWQVSWQHYSQQLKVETSPTPTTGEWANKTGILHDHKRTEALTHTETWKNLENRVKGETRECAPGHVSWGRMPGGCTAEGEAPPARCKELQPSQGNKEARLKEAT